MHIFYPRDCAKRLRLNPDSFLAEQFQEITRNLPKERIPLRFIHKQKKEQLIILLSDAMRHFIRTSGTRIWTSKYLFYKVK